MLCTVSNRLRASAMILVLHCDVVCMVCTSVADPWSVNTSVTEGMFIPDPNFSIPAPVSKVTKGSRGQKAPDLGSESATLVSTTEKIVHKTRYL